jgi:hypothetical protein
LEAWNRITKAEATVVQKLNQSAEGGVLFWFFFAQAKKNKKYFN